MNLELDPLDLDPKYQEGTEAERNINQAINTRDVTFDKLNEKAKAAVTAVGRAVITPGIV